MKRKFLNKLKPLICKKRSKKRKIIIYEYENNISNLMKKLKLEDNESERSSSDENMPPDIRAFESTMRNKLLRCNLKTYSTYSSSKNLNIYKKAESKCIRFISINTYLQGKVFSTSNSSKLAIAPSSQFYQNKNKYIVTEPKPLLNITNTFESNKYGRCLLYGKFGSKLNLSLKLTNVYKSIYFDLTERFMGEKEFTLSSKHWKFSKVEHHKELQLYKNTLPKTTHIPFIEKRIFSFHRKDHSSQKSSIDKLMPYSNIKSSNDIFGKDCKSVKTDEESISNHLLEGEQYASETHNINLDRIKRTIIDLLRLDLEMEKYVFIFKMFNYVSPCMYDINILKKKFAYLVTEYQYLKVKECKSNNENCIQNNFLTEKMKIPKHDSYGDYEALTVLKKPVNADYIPLPRKRNCKRSKKDKEKNMLFLKRSKKLDECILRANGVDSFYTKRENISIICSPDIMEKNVQQVSEDKSLVEGKTFSKILGSDCHLESANPALRSIDVHKEEIHDASLKLPLFNETFKDIQKVKSKILELENLSKTEYYDIEGGKKLVVLPYINIY